MEAREQLLRDEVKVGAIFPLGRKREHNLFFGLGVKVLRYPPMIQCFSLYDRGYLVIMSL